jgi:hypothetical protein
VVHNKNATRVLQNTQQNIKKTGFGVRINDPVLLVSSANRAFFFKLSSGWYRMNNKARAKTILGRQKELTYFASKSIVEKE